MAAGRSPLVLLVEDDRDTREMYSEFLSYAGLRVAAAGDASRALQRARDERPDVVVTDIAMPGMDGLELSRRLRATPPTREVPIIAVTGNPTARECDAGCCDLVLEKPCAPDRLLHAIEDVLGKA